jgi:hypothetical protein
MYLPPPSHVFNDQDKIKDLRHAARCRCLLLHHYITELHSRAGMVVPQFNVSFSGRPMISGQLQLSRFSRRTLSITPRSSVSSAQFSLNEMAKSPTHLIGRTIRSLASLLLTSS